MKKELKKRIKNKLPQRFIYFYEIIRVLPMFIKISLKSIGIKYPNYNFYSNIETVDMIVNQGKSISRFGDGEFMWMMGKTHNSFQDYSEDLRIKLIEVLNNSNNNLLIGFPKGMITSKGCNINAKIHWKLIRYNFFSDISKMLSPQRKYIDASITRPYIDYTNSKYSENEFNNLKRIWNERNIVIVEGEKTKLGIGNDLFNNAKKIERIICPAENAFSKLNEIKQAILNIVDKSKLILVALGPTATILASDMTNYGYQIIDIGHIDIEYSWYKMKAKIRVPIDGKYVNESGSKECSNAFDDDKEYVTSIIDRVI